jgi:hypothetical protein
LIKKIQILLIALMGFASTAMLYAQSTSNIDISIAAIKKYRVSQLSDQQLKEAWDKAEQIRQEEIKTIEKNKIEFLDRRAKLQKACADFIYEQRNAQECSNARSLLPISLSDEKPKSREMIYEGLVLGLCNFIDSKNINKLREFNCIP